jgi:hypothetical protein
MLPDFERADRIGEFWGYPESRNFAELLIDWEDDQRLWGGGSSACCERPTARGVIGALGASAAGATRQPAV